MLNAKVLLGNSYNGVRPLINTGKKVYWHAASNEVRNVAGGGAVSLGHAFEDTTDDAADILIRLGWMG